MRHITLFRFVALTTVLLLCSGIMPAHAQRKKKKTEEPKVLSVYDIDTLQKTIPRQRDRWHDGIDKAQTRADRFDGRKDGLIVFARDTAYTRLLTKALLQDVDHLQIMVENLPGIAPATENNIKIGYLRNIEETVQKFSADNRPDPIYYRRLITSLRDMIIARHENRINEYAVAHPDVYTLGNIALLEGFPEGEATVYTAVGNEYPGMLIKRLREYASKPYADAIIASAAKVLPNDIYTYASSTNYTLSSAIRRSKDPLVQTIVRVADKSKAPLKAMSFLDDIHNGRKTIAEIDVITADADLLYKNLVRLKLEGQQLGGDTYTRELQFRGLKYVRIMNDLHDAKSPAVRFKCIDGFTPEELYFIMVYGQDEIYTSSFLGTFTRMMERMAGRTGDSLLAAVRYDHFRTFIRICAGYNTLTPFLATMQEQSRNVLMRDFVANLERGREDELEDAVDVADAFGSVKDSALADFLREEVRQNYRRVDISGTKGNKGVLVYALLTTLFRRAGGADSAGADSLSADLNLPPINKVPFTALINDSGTVYAQTFFYGDEDGKMSFSSFMGNFKNANWKTANPNAQWSTATSLDGKPVTYFANQPLPEPADEEAQQALQKFMDETEVHPTIIIHRGHSYHLSTTIEHLEAQNRIVMLGSCGGYHNLGTVLDKAPDAQIISTKQTGTARVNDAIIQAINARLLAGEDIDWIQLWDGLEKSLAAFPAVLKDFREYVPPHRNLGAIFIKAYRRWTSLSDAS